MTLKNRILELTPNEEKELDIAIKELIKEFETHQGAKADFNNLIKSKKVTMRILCKLSEWCNTDSPKYNNGKKYALRISEILFGDRIPKLDGHEIILEDDIIKIGLN